MIGSAEQPAHTVDVLFQDILRRHSDAGGNSSWASFLQKPSAGGVPPELQIVAGLMTSAEYAALVQAAFPLKPVVPADPFAASL